MKRSDTSSIEDTDTVRICAALVPLIQPIPLLIQKLPCAKTTQVVVHFEIKIRHLVVHRREVLIIANGSLH
jgi:hypothetical protein